MRIVHMNQAAAFGGGEVQTLNLVSWLAAQKVEQLVVARKGSPLAQRLNEVLPQVKILSLRQLWGLLLRSRNAQKEGLVLHAHDGRSLHQCALLGRVFSLPSLATRRVDKGISKHWLSRLSYRNLDQLVAVSSRIQQRIEDGLGPGCCCRIPDSFSGFSVDQIRVQEIRQRFAGKRLIGQIGSLYAIKGHRYTIEVARQLAAERPEFHFVFLGEGEEHSHLESLAADLPNLSFVGFVKDVGNWLAALELLVHPSLREGLGSILLEAQQFGVPVVASEVGGIPDVVLHQRTGFLVPPADSAALKSAVVRLMDDQDLRRRMIADARKHLLNFTPQAVGQAYLDLYRKLLSRA